MEVMRIENSIGYRALLYSSLTAIPYAIVMTLLGFHFRKLWLWGLVSAIFILFVMLMTYFGTLRMPVEVRIGPECIQLVFRKGKREEIPWKNILSISPRRLDPGFYELKYLDRNRKLSLKVLSKEPAQKIRQIRFQNY